MLSVSVRDCGLAFEPRIDCPSAHRRALESFATEPPDLGFSELVAAMDIADMAGETAGQSSSVGLKLKSPDRAARPIIVMVAPYLQDPAS